VFITGLTPADAAANVGFFTGPLQYRADVKDTVVDYDTQTVRLTLRNGKTRVARRYGSQGCVPLPIGADSVSFTPSVVTSNLPPAASTPWPMGDVLPTAPLPREIDQTLLAQAMDEAFGPAEAMTLGLVVTYKGRIIGERYADGIGMHTPLESWSMCKSLTGTLVARLIQMGVYRLDQPAPIPEWQTAGDPRQKIRIVDIMRMSSGLRLRAQQDPGYDPALGYPDHPYLYAGSPTIGSESMTSLGVMDSDPMVGPHGMETVDGRALRTLTTPSHMHAVSSCDATHPNCHHRRRPRWAARRPPAARGPRRLRPDRGPRPTRRADPHGERRRPARR